MCTSTSPLVQTLTALEAQQGCSDRCGRAACGSAGAFWACWLRAASSIREEHATRGSESHVHRVAAKGGEKSSRVRMGSCHIFPSQAAPRDAFAGRHELRLGRADVVAASSVCNRSFCSFCSKRSVQHAFALIRCKQDKSHWCALCAPSANIITLRRTSDATLRRTSELRGCRCRHTQRSVRTRSVQQRQARCSPSASQRMDQR